MKKSNAEIIETIKKHKVLTERELTDILNYKKRTLNRRIKILTMFGILDYIIIPADSSLSTYHFFKKYIDTRLYFTDKDDLEYWLYAKIPKTWNLIKMKQIMRIVGKYVKKEMK